MSMEIVMPKTGLTNTENALDKWQVSEGEQVKKGQVLAEIESEKTTMPFESPEDGIIHLVAGEGDTVPVGGVIAHLAADQAEYESSRHQCCAPWTAALFHFFEKRQHVSILSSLRYRKLHHGVINPCLYFPICHLFRHHNLRDHDLFCIMKHLPLSGGKSTQGIPLHQALNDPGDLI